MADHINNLFAIAEIAGVFIGFAALVTVVARGSREESQHEDTFKLANVVIINVMIITAALFPVVLNSYGITPSGVWRSSSGFLWVVTLLPCSASAVHLRRGAGPCARLLPHRHRGRRLSEQSPIRGSCDLHDRAV
jgi:hypothetical protein